MLDSTDPRSSWKWYLNGTFIGFFKGVSDENLEHIKYVRSINDVRCFTSDKLPSGTLELKSDEKIIAIITSLKDMK